MPQSKNVTGIDFQVGGNFEQAFTRLQQKATSLQVELSNISTTLSNIETKAKNIQNISIKNDFSKLAQGTGFVQTTNASVLMRNGNIGDSRRANDILKAQNELSKAQADLARETARLAKARKKRADLENKNYTQILSNQTKNANLKQAKADNYAAEVQARMVNAESNRKWREYKMANPDLFGSIRNRPNYELGVGLSGVGNSTKGAGVLGHLVGNGLDIAGKALKYGGKAGLVGAAIFAADAIKKFGQAALEAYGQIDSIKAQLSVVFGSPAQSDKMFSDISEYAVKSPFGVEQTSEMAILLKQSGVYASDLMDTLKMIGDTAGGNMEKMQRIANNYAQIVSIGKASMLDMRQFAYAGIPIFQAVSDELGVSQARLRQMISDGQVTSDIIEKVFKNLTGVNGVFENATEVGAKTFKARLQNLKDTKQLAMASTGELIQRMGMDTQGNGSTLNGVVKLLESFYSGLKNWADFKTLKDDVRDIRNKKLWNRYKENKKDDTTLNKMYEAQVLQNDAILQARKTVKENGYSGEFMNRLTEVLTLPHALLLKVVGSFSPLALFPSAGSWLDELGNKFLDTANEAGTVADTLRSANKNLKDFKEDLVIAHGRVSILYRQAEMTDVVEKSSKTKDSVYNVSNDILAKYEQTEEYKKEQQAKQLSLWTETVKILKEIKLAQPNGKDDIDLTKVNYKQFLNWQKKGGLSSSTLAVTAGEDRNKFIQEENYAEVLSNTNWAISNLKQMTNSKALRGYINEFEKGFTKALNDKNAGRITIDSFADKYNSLFTSLDESLKKIGENRQTETGKQSISDMRTILGSSLLHFSANTSAADKDIKNLLENGSGSVAIPLWKRILSGYTGISTNNITSTAKTIDAYSNYKVPQQMANSIFSQVLKETGNTSIVQSLLATNGTKVGDTYQANWKETRERLKEFALSLQSSTEVLNLYEQSLDNTKNVYAELLAAALTETESADMSATKKTVSAKTLAKFSDNETAQLLTDFGEQLQTSTGENVAYIKKGIAYDKNGNELANQNLEITGNILRILQEKFDQIKVDIKQASLDGLAKTIVQAEANKAGANAISAGLYGQAAAQGLNADTVKSYQKELQDAITKQLKNSVIGEGNEYKSLEDFYNHLKDANGGLDKLNDIIGEILQNNSQNLSKPTTPDTQQGSQNFGLLMDRLRNGNQPFKDIDAYGDGTKDKDLRAFQNADKRARRLGNQNSSVLEALGITGNYSQFADALKEYNKKQQDRRNALSSSVNKEDFSISKDDISSLELEGFDKEKLSMLADENKTLEERKAIYQDLLNSAKDLTAQGLLNQTSWAAAGVAVQGMTDNMYKALKETAKGQYTKVFETIGASAIQGSEAWEDMEEAMKQSALQLMGDMGTYMTQAGWSLVTYGAENKNKKLIATGLMLAAAGGVTSGLAGALQDDGEDEEEDETKRLEDLKDDLAKLIEQARDDSLYYERNLRHKTALGVNASVSSKTSVHDALIDTNGKIITTDPKDYLIATKQPENLIGGGGVVVQPQVNVNVINNSNANVNVRTEQQEDSEGNLQLYAYIEDVAANFIASSKSDDAFSARNYRLQGRQAIR